MTKPNPSGLIGLENDSVVYRIDGKEVWRIAAGDIRAIGAYTNDHGPVLDDYFFVFVTDDPRVWCEASFYADGSDSLLAALSLRLGHELHPDLCGSTTLKSRVMWPKQLEGQELFAFIPEARASNVLGRLRQKVLPKVFFELSEPVRKLIGDESL